MIFVVNGALVGFTVALAPISIQLMGWRGAMGQSAAIHGTFPYLLVRKGRDNILSKADERIGGNRGATYFFGGMLLIISGLLEFFPVNTFPCVVFFGYGGHFLTFGATFQPFHNAVATYTSDGTQDLTPGFGTFLPFLCISPPHPTSTHPPPFQLLLYIHLHPHTNTTPSQNPHSPSTPSSCPSSPSSTSSAPSDRSAQT
ncbi:Protein alcS [Lachnellula hyalina]|uniref:Protein alcS n=1 Tax=Lachnellula hyalina TaxID=1316788 RepID=A0A8H8QYQ3_9HELO|nr:Protein alcS [Lachnellula hyalina]TVY25199.1 Protein alcS [Lachnellula hyalina]